MDTKKAQALKEFSVLYHLSDELYHEAAVAMELSDSAFDILYCLNELGDGCLQRDICAASCLTKQTVNTSVHKLARAGLLQLKAEQGRAVSLHLTRAGRAVVDERIKPVVVAEEEAFDALTTEEAVELLRLTKLYLERLRERVRDLPRPEQQGQPGHPEQPEQPGQQEHPEQPGQPGQRGR